MSQTSIGPKDVKGIKSAIEGSGSDGFYVMSERLAEEIVDRMKAGASKRDQQAVESLKAFLKDTIEFIYKTHKAKGKLSPTEVTQYVLKKHKNFLGALGFDHAACGLAVAGLIVTLTTTVPVMAMESKALIVTTGMAFATGGIGVPFALGSLALLGLSGLSVYLSASQTAQVCSVSLSTLADRWGQANNAQPTKRTGGTNRLRCEVPVSQFPFHVFGMLSASLAREPSQPLYTPLR